MGNVGDVLRGAREAEREQIYSSVYKLKRFMMTTLERSCKLRG